MWNAMWVWWLWCCDPPHFHCANPHFFYRHLFFLHHLVLTTLCSTTECSSFLFVNNQIFLSRVFGAQIFLV